MIRAIKKVIKRIIGINNLIAIKSKLAFRGNPELKEALDINAQFKNKYKGQRCFIIGNGPSIKNVDFSTLANEYTFSVNQLPRNPNFEKLKTNFHVWADERFFDLDESKPEDMELLEVMKQVNSGENRPIVFYKYAAKEMVKKYDLSEKLNIYYYEDLSVDRKQLVKLNFDFTKIVPKFSTVVHYIICLAVYMGFKEIVLLGCDCTGIISTAQARVGKAENAAYGYAISDNEKKRMEKVQSQTSFRDEMSWWVEIFDDYKTLDQYCKRNKVKLLNATNPTLLEEIAKCDLNDVLNQ